MPEKSPISVPDDWNQEMDVRYFFSAAFEWLHVVARSKHLAPNQSGVSDW